MKRMKQFLMNSIILSVTTILLRGMSVGFTVYISNKIGFSGIGLIELIMSVFYFAYILATSGVGLAATRLVAEELALKSNSGIHAVMRKCIAYSIIFGIFAATLLLFSADFVGTNP